MDSALIDALEANSPTTVLLLTVVLPGGTIRLTDGGFVVWSGNTYDSRDEVYGTMGAVEEIEDGVDNTAGLCAITVLPPDDTALAALASPLVQGAPVTVHLGAVNRLTGLLEGEPELLFRGELNYARLGVGDSWSLVLECTTEEGRQLEPNAAQMLTDSFHKSVWPGERGFEHVIELGRPIYWREDTPRGAIS